jgi:hypothetical protein
MTVLRFTLTPTVALLLSFALVKSSLKHEQRELREATLLSQFVSFSNECAIRNKEVMTFGDPSTDDQYTTKNVVSFMLKRDSSCKLIEYIRMIGGPLIVLYHLVEDVGTSIMAAR